MMRKCDVYYAIFCWFLYSSKCSLVITSQTTQKMLLKKKKKVYISKTMILNFNVYVCKSYACHIWCATALQILELKCLILVKLMLHNQIKWSHFSSVCRAELLRITNITEVCDLRHHLYPQSVFPHAIFSVCFFFHLLSNLLYESPNHPLSDLCFNCSTAVICTLKCFTVGIKWIQCIKKQTNVETKKEMVKKEWNLGNDLWWVSQQEKPLPASPFLSLYTLLLLDLSIFSSFLILQCPHLFFQKNPHALLSYMWFLH